MATTDSSEKKIHTLYEYENLDDFIWWLNYKLKNDGLFEVNKNNIESYLLELENQRISLNIDNHFILPCFATRSGNREIYKYKTVVKNGKIKICL